MNACMYWYLCICIIEISGVGCIEGNVAAAIISCADSFDVELNIL